MRDESILKTRSFSFAVRIVNLYKHLTSTFKEYELSKQILGSGTAIGSLIREAQNAETKKDFIHKLGIAQKECDETCYWLELLYATDFLKKAEFNSLHPESVEILKMLKSAIITAKKNLDSDNSNKSKTHNL